MLGVYRPRGLAGLLAELPAPPSATATAATAQVQQIDIEQVLVRLSNGSLTIEESMQIVVRAESSFTSYRSAP
jgi:hypothetical protein